MLLLSKAKWLLLNEYWALMILRYRAITIGKSVLGKREWNDWKQFTAGDIKIEKETHMHVW